MTDCDVKLKNVGSSYLFELMSKLTQIKHTQTSSYPITEF